MFLLTKRQHPSALATASKHGQNHTSQPSSPNVQIVFGVTLVFGRGGRVRLYRIATFFKETISYRLCTFL
jgi:hypothetical protein